jgi:hypothetical protein
MIGVWECHRQRVEEYGCRILKGNVTLFEIRRSLSPVPLPRYDPRCASDFDALGRSMIDNTCAQAELHPAPVGPHHAAIIEIARQARRAAREGRSWAARSPCSAAPELLAKRAMIRAIEESNPVERPAVEAGGQRTIRTGQVAVPSKTSVRMPRMLSADCASALTARGKPTRPERRRASG